MCAYMSGPATWTHQALHLHTHTTHRASVDLALSVALAKLAERLAEAEGSTAGSSG